MSATDTDRPDEGTSPDPQEPQVIVARAGRYYRNARYLMVVIGVGLGLWFAYDGWKKWPAENAEARAKGDEKLPHSEAPWYLGGDIALQRVLGAGLPAIGIGLLAYFLYRSRGEYRL